MAQTIIQAAVSQVGFAADKLYSYAVPQEMSGRVRPGMRVMVPFGQGSRAREAVVMRVDEDGRQEPVLGSRKVKGQENRALCLEEDALCGRKADGSNTKQSGRAAKSEGLDESAPIYLREIHAVLDEAPVLSEPMLRLAAFLKRRYFCTWYEAIKPLLPPGSGVKLYEFVSLAEEKLEDAQEAYSRAPAKRRILAFLSEKGGSALYTELQKNMPGASLRRLVKDMQKDGFLELSYREKANAGDKKIRVARLAASQDAALAFTQSTLKTAPVQAKMVEILLENEAVAVKDLLYLTKGSYSSLRALEKKGLIALEEMVVERPLEQRPVTSTEHFTPTTEQKQVIDTVSQAVAAKKEGYYLLQGVTGSGKTEVYLQLIQKVLNGGRQAIVLVPEISLTPQTVYRFRQRFGDRVAVFHSGLSLTARYEQWKKIRQGRVDVAVGARSCVFAPFSNLGMIVMDEEHETTYQSESSPRYDTREVAAYRARQEHAVLLMASATPSVESRYACDRGTCTLLKMTARYNENKMPQMLVADMRRELPEGNSSIFSRLLQREIQQNLDRGQQTILFLNRRGFSTFVSCRSCGYVMMCPHCSVSLTYHKKTQSLQCHYCGYRAPQVHVCPQCSSRHIKYFGIGTQRVEEEVHALFPSATTLRMDLDTTASKFSHEKILERFTREKVDILIGTQMVSKGLDFENVTLVGVIAADLGLNSADYRCCERTFSQIVQVSGRAGRGSCPGRAVIQTYQPDHYAIQLAKTQDYDRFYTQEIKFRKNLNYPPFCDIITMFLTGPHEELTQKAARFLYEKVFEAVRPYGARFSVLSPHASDVYRVSGKYRWLFSVKCPKHISLQRVFSSALEAYFKERFSADVSVSVGVNASGLR